MVRRIDERCIASYPEYSNKQPSLCILEKQNMTLTAKRDTEVISRFAID